MTKKTTVAPITLAVDPQRVVYHNGENVVCLDRQSGEESWISQHSVAVEAAVKAAPNLVIHGDVVLFSAGPGEVTSISIKDGKTLWTDSHGRTGHQSAYDLLVADGLVWSTSGGRVQKKRADYEEAFKLAQKPGWTNIGRDPVSGEVKRVFPPGKSDWFHHRCHRGRATDRYMIMARTGIEYIDLKTGQWTPSYGIEVLNRRHDQPFFLAVGLVKPHMPFSVPKKWFDMFPLESIELPPHREGDLDDVPAAGVRMAKPGGDHAAILKSGRWKEAVQAYLATIAFCDSQVGRLLDALEQSAYRDNTIICLWSDHGCSLGEKEHWRKFALWEEPTRTVFIWKVPGMTPAGVQSPRPVDFMSIYPTICSLTEVKKPAHVEGLDISPLLKNPNAKWDTPALTTFHKDNHSFRSEQWRYIRYADGSEELYNHQTDPFEWTNVAGNPEHAAIKAGFARHIPSVNASELPGGGGKSTKRASQQKAKTKERK